VSYAPTPEQLLGELSGRPCAVLHIVAAVREFSGGIFLDFESTEGRIEQRRGEEHSFLTPTYLDRVLASLKQPPFVILDIAHPDNDAETVRRLLLRNSFADHLFQLGNTCGVLAAGLVDRFNQEFTAGPLIREVMNGAPMAQVLRLVRANQQSTSPHYPLASELPSLGAALFSDHPDVSPFAQAAARMNGIPLNNAGVRNSPAKSQSLDLDLADWKRRTEQPYSGGTTARCAAWPPPGGFLN